MARDPAWHNIPPNLAPTKIAMGRAQATSADQVALKTPLDYLPEDGSVQDDDTVVGGNEQSDHETDTGADSAHESDEDVNLQDNNPDLTRRNTDTKQKMSTTTMGATGGGMGWKATSPLVPLAVRTLPTRPHALSRLLRTAAR